jgi:acyl transferase domain-containing protein/NAD(P)H-dependent flavin oxidoreductase YrpB (nitropropane dioxygenase family)/NAD(P)-dependent dehydrogenase (short-subunit alcohol dehydrogenase family)/acyl carrier protein
MNKRASVNLDQFVIFVENLPGMLNLGPVIAATRRGAGSVFATGVLNLEGTPDGVQAQGALDRVARLAHGDFAVKLNAFIPSSAELIAKLPARAATVILTGVLAPEFLPLALALKRAGRRVLGEITGSEEAAAAMAAGVDGLVAKGQEAGGIVGEETSFILLQRLLGECSLPVWIHGGIGPHTISACYAGGAAGVVLDSQVLLTAESTIPSKLRAALERAGGDETLCLGRELGLLTRLWKRPGMKATEQLEKMEIELRSKPLAEAQAAWRKALVDGARWKNPETDFWLLGQDSVFAATFGARYGTVAEVIDGLRSAIVDHVSAAQRLAPLGRNSALAKDHGTDFPILQGPMTRVSDTAEFANYVAEGGGLPFLALALLRGPQVRRLMEKTRDLAGAKSWGVGILGFVPTELREEQLAVVRDIKPPFALIAGGRPDQAASLEKLGIRTYLHVPAPPLLKMFIEDGSRRFIFEGRECGGHVGPRTSFVLWETMIDALLESIGKGVKAEELHIIFAGGIHDAQSAAMVSAMAAPLAEKGVKLGVLMGTAYLFTREAVQGGAIVDTFQEEALNCRHTVILESGPGHATRCVDTGFAEQFREVRNKLQAEGKSHEQIKDALEALNVGRLRIASKGIDRVTEGDKVQYVQVEKEKQLEQGMYMIGQIASLHAGVCTVRELHEAVSAGSAEWLKNVAAPELPAVEEPAAEKPCDIAIVGVSSMMPKASNVREFWSNIVNKVNAITEVPKTRFDADRHFDADKKARDKMYSRWGGFLSDVAFDPMHYGIPPNALASIDPMQLLALLGVEDALKDAGLDTKPFDRSRTSVILGMSGGLGDVGLNYAVRSTLPEYVENVPESVLSQMPEWTEDTFAGILLNVTAGRIANRFNFGGVNFTVDAACASSLAAVSIACRELTAQSSDTVVVGGIDTLQSPFGFMCFAKAQALSPRGQCRPFDESADGIAISEGVTILVLKRLSDAERAGDRVYAVIKGVAGSSDGRGRSMTAPKPEGQMAVLRRAYRQAGYGPSTVQLFEAHGTGTAAGDAAEITSLSETLLADGAKPGLIAVGSVKSMVGHTKAAAGVTGLLKIALALYHKVLPATLNVDKPNARLKDKAIPVYANTETRPWIRISPELPLRAGVSSFGFGGTNFHAALEEYTGEIREPEDIPAVEAWPAELFLFSGSADAVTSSLNLLSANLTAGNRQPLRQMSAQAAQKISASKSGVRLAIVARSHDDLAGKLAKAKDLLASGSAASGDAKAGIFVTPVGAETPKLAFLYPGQGSQQPNMLRELAVYFSEFRTALERADQVLAGRFARKLSDYIYPAPVFDAAEEKRQMAEITATGVAQPALGAVEIALTHLLGRLGVVPDMTAGHSYGEYTALAAAGVITEDTLFELSERRGNAIEEATRGGDAGTMAAVLAEAGLVETALNGASNITIANYNSPKQTIIAGTKQDVAAAIEKLTAQKLAAKAIPVACAFHSPLMAPARERLAAVLDRQTYSAPTAQVFSNTLAAPYPEASSEIAELLASHLVKPVRFVDQIRAMHDAGARVFVEVGPKNVLSNLAKANLEGREAVILQTDAAGDRGMEQFLGVLGQLWTLGVPLEMDELLRGRIEKVVVAPTRAPQWMVNGAGTYAVSAPPQVKKPVRLVDPATIKPEIRTVEVVKEVVRNVAGPAGTVMAAPVMAAPVMDVGVIVEYQRMMQQFLQSQTAIMQSFLGAPSQAVPAALPVAAAPVPAPAPAPVVSAPPPVAVVVVPPPTPAPVIAVAVPAAPAARNIEKELVAIVSERTGYPAEMLDLDAGIEADLGIDSIKRVEVLSAFQRNCSEAEQKQVQGMMEKLTSARTLREIAGKLGSIAMSGPAAVVNAVAPTATPARNTLQELVAIVSDRTGYPTDMLDVNAGIESDLGIDSIKRVEILSAFQRTCSEVEQKLVQGMMEKLTSARTLNEMASRLAEIGGSGVPPTPVVAAAVVSAPAVTRHVLKEILAIVSDRTGYPTDMLDVNAGIESDLGIDSIKRVEILSAFQRTCSEAEQKLVQGMMEKLTSARTLSEMAARLSELGHSVPAASPVPVQPAPPQRDTLADVVAIVSDRTGYPVDMLDVDAGIESDLGIDSIKRVEILSAFQRTLDETSQGRVQGSMEKLTSARTLREISERIDSALHTAATVAAPAIPEKSESVARFTLTTVERPRASSPKHFPGRVVLMTDDENGIASAVAESMQAAGDRVLLVRHSPGSTLHTEGVYSTDLTDPAQVAAMMEAVRSSYGAPIGAVVHLLPLASAKPFEQLTFSEWRSLVRQDVRSLYLLAKYAEGDLKSAGKAKGALVAVVTGRGGEFGLAPHPTRAATHFAAADFVKTLALEFDDVLCKVIDVDPSDPVAILRQKLVEELGAFEDVLQVGLPGDRRLSVAPAVTPLPAGPLHEIDSNSVVLLTGGARGITAGIAKTLAQRAKPSLILAGASPLPPAEDARTASITDPPKLKAALLEDLRASGKKTVKPAEVEAAYSRLMKNREIQRNLAELSALGSKVEYHAVDVRDEKAFGALIDSLYERFGRIDVVIHGAGVIEDKLIKDKTPESFDRVVHTKTDSSFVLTRKLRPADTKCLILMSSITAAFGNRGQADYAAANGAMNGISSLLASQWPGRVVAMNWGPWDQGGMVSDDVRRQFLAQGIELIVPAEGDEAVMRELALTSQGAPIAVFGDGPWRKIAVTPVKTATMGSTV